MYAVLVFLEAGYSGTSTNPARSLGPAVIAHCWTGWWIYWLGPTLGSLLGVLLVTRWLPLRQFEIEVAKLYHFNHDPHQFFHQRSFPSRQGLGS
jgi:aquaporin Z